MLPIISLHILHLSEHTGHLMTSDTFMVIFQVCRKVRIFHEFISNTWHSLGAKKAH